MASLQGKLRSKCILSSHYTLLLGPKPPRDTVCFGCIMGNDGTRFRQGRKNGWNFKKMFFKTVHHWHKIKRRSTAGEWCVYLKKTTTTTTNEQSTRAFYLARTFYKARMRVIKHAREIENAGVFNRINTSMSPPEFRRAKDWVISGNEGQVCWQVIRTWLENM